MLNRAFAVGLVWALAAASPAFAEADYAREGWYLIVGASGGYDTRLEKAVETATDNRPNFVVDGASLLTNGDPVNDQLFSNAFGFTPADGLLPTDPRPGGGLDINHSSERSAMLPTQTNNTGGLNLRFGRRVTPNFAVEVQADYLEGFDVKTELRDPGDTTVGRPARTVITRFEIPTVSGIVNLKTYLTTGRIQPFLLTGVGAMWAFPDKKKNAERRLPAEVRDANGNLDRFNDAVARIANFFIDRTPILDSDPNPSRSEFAQLENFSNRLREQVRDRRDSARIDGVAGVYQFGLGLDLYLTENWALSLEGSYIGAYGQAGDVEHLHTSAGVMYRF